jgi:hypothetical protein
VKRIVVCADGTWNERDLIDKKTGRWHSTNVTRLLPHSGVLALDQCGEATQALRLANLR